ncbi:hypothetical protein B0H10DRAFT_1965131 [Mycena sp. CBHHK59/15]|nr:hypothetical protein B0H10DRAFT_1965131 [Mycena sp. CBHHK59/15]
MRSEAHDSFIARGRRARAAQGSGGIERRPRKPAAKADRAVGEQFKVSLESGVMTNSRNEFSHRTARNTKRHTSAIQKAQQAHAGQKKIAELRAQLAIAVAEAKRHEKTAVVQDELEGIEMMTAPEAAVGNLDGEGNPNLPELAGSVSEAVDVEDRPAPPSNNTLSPLSESEHSFHLHEPDLRKKSIPIPLMNEDKAEYACGAEEDSTIRLRNRWKAFILRQFDRKLKYVNCG